MFCPTGTHRYCCRIRESVERRGGCLREEHILAAQYYVTSERQETMLRKDDGLGLSLTPEGPVLRSRGLGLNSVPRSLTLTPTVWRVCSHTFLPSSSAALLALCTRAALPSQLPGAGLGKQALSDSLLHGHCTMTTDGKLRRLSPVACQWVPRQCIFDLSIFYAYIIILTYSGHIQTMKQPENGGRAS